MNFSEAIAEADIRALSNYCGYKWQKEEYDNTRLTFSANIRYHIHTIMAPRSMIWHILLKGAESVFGVDPPAENFARVDLLHMDRIPIGTKWTQGRIVNFIADKLDYFIDKLKLSQICDNTPETVIAADLVIKPGDIWVVKPIEDGAESGYAVQAVANQADLLVARNYINSHPNWNAIACRYIMRPLLFKGYKFHIRGYIAVRSWANAIFMPSGSMYLATEPYQEGNWGNRNIHITHYSANPTSAVFPDDILGLNAGPQLVANYRKIMENICSKLPRASPPVGAAFAYEIIAPDIMFDMDSRAWLIEINRSVNNSIDSPGRNIWDRQFVNWEFTNCVEPILARQRHRYWLFAGAVADYGHLKELMSIAGLDPYPDTEYTRDGNLIRTNNRIGQLLPFFLHVTGMPDKNASETHGQLHNDLDLHLCPINDKKFLLTTLKEWVAESTTLERFTWAGYSAICLPAGSGFTGGRGIKFIENMSDVDIARAYYKGLKEEEKKAGRVFSVVVSRYLTNIHLWHGKKYHISVFCIISGYSGGIENVKMSHFGKIIHAEAPFKPAHYNNKDAHYESIDEDIYYPQDFEPKERVAEINNQLDKIAAALLPIVQPLRPYPGFENGYVILRANVIVMDDFQIKLINMTEVYDLGVTYYNDKSDDYYKNLGDFEYEYGVKPAVRIV